MNDADLKAIFAYLRTVPAAKNKVPEPVSPAPAAMSNNSCLDVVGRLWTWDSERGKRPLSPGGGSR